MVVVITGASSGIGLATARFLAQKGFDVVGISRHPKKEEIFEGVACDLTDFIATEKALKDIANRKGKIDVLVNNAGMGIAGAVEHTPMADVQKQFNLNVFALVNACRAVVPIMRAQGQGKIVNIASVAGVIPIPFQSFYSASKSAVIQFSLAFGLEVKNFGIKTSVVLPGDTKTSFTKNRIKNDVVSDEHYQKRIEKSIEKMERDEQNGKPPQTVAKVILRVINRKNPPARIAVGFGYKVIVFLEKILPTKLMLWVVKKIYG